MLTIGEILGCIMDRHMGPIYLLLNVKQVYLKKKKKQCKGKKFDNFKRPIQVNLRIQYLYIKHLGKNHRSKTKMK